SRGGHPDRGRAGQRRARDSRSGRRAPDRDQMGGGRGAGGRRGGAATEADAEPAGDHRRSPLMDTVLRSRSREVVISADRPFVMIGERINPTGRKVLAAEMRAGLMDRVKADA